MRWIERNLNWIQYNRYSNFVYIQVNRLQVWSIDRRTTSFVQTIVCWPMSCCVVSSGLYYNYGTPLFPCNFFEVIVNANWVCWWYYWSTEWEIIPKQIDEKGHQQRSMSTDRGISSFCFIVIFFIREQICCELQMLLIMIIFQQRFSQEIQGWKSCFNVAFDGYLSPSTPSHPSSAKSCPVQCTVLIPPTSVRHEAQSWLSSPS